MTLVEKHRLTSLGNLSLSECVIEQERRRYTAVISGVGEAACKCDKDHLTSYNKTCECECAPAVTLHVNACSST